jgi:GDPmannose 4,6-dehydratase
MDAVRKIVPKARVYQASTSEMFGKTKPPQSERSKFQPVSPYGEAKVRAHLDFIKGYRDKYKLFAVSGILFNHESPRRGEHFVTRKITLCLSKIKLGMLDAFELGNLDAMRDWGFAGDYVEAMWLMLQQKKPQDFVIATGESHTVRDFLKAAASALDMKLVFEGKGLDEVVKDEQGRVIVRVNPKFYRPNEVDALRGDASKAKKVLGWKPRHSFKQLVAMMVQSDMEMLARRL